MISNFLKNITLLTSIVEAVGLDFIAGIDRTQQYLTSESPSQVFYYRNSFDYPESLHRRLGCQLNGTAHADDILHIFWVGVAYQPLNPESAISIHRKKMVRMWTNFAKTG